MKRESSRAVIIDNNRVLTMFRRKIDEAGNKNEYYAIPGGAVVEDIYNSSLLNDLIYKISISNKILTQN